MDKQDLEKQLVNTQRYESLGILAAGIAHTFNNLLMGISGNLELIRHVVGSDSQATRFVDNAFAASKRAADLARQMLVYTRNGADGANGIDLNRVVGEITDLLKASLLKGVTVTACLEGELPLFQAESCRVQQVVMNLVINAAEAIEGHGALNIETGVAAYDAAALSKSLAPQTSGAGNFLYLTISDDGCGMSAETMERLCEPFFTSKTAGRGLGLAAVREILKGMGGAFFVESEEGVGTSVKVLFPLPEAAEGETTGERIKG